MITIVYEKNEHKYSFALSDILYFVNVNINKDSANWLIELHDIALECYEKIQYKLFN